MDWLGFLVSENLQKTCTKTSYKVAPVTKVANISWWHHNNRQQANSENCGPPLGNKFDLEVGQRSLLRSRHGTIGKVLSQRIHMPSIKALPVIVQKLWPRLKFLWRTDGQTDRGTDGQTDRRMRFNVPVLSRKRGTTSKRECCETLVAIFRIVMKLLHDAPQNLLEMIH